MADAGSAAAAAHEPAADAASSAGAAHSSAAAPAAAHAEYGTVLFAGCAAHSLCGRQQPPAQTFDGVDEVNLWGFHRMAALADVKVKRVISGPTAVHYMAIDVDGGLYVWGRNERGQLGLANGNINRYNPTKVAGLPPVVTAAAGKNHSMLVTADGSLYACGENKMGQCSVGKPSDVPIVKWSKVAGVPPGTAVAVACGVDFSVALDRDGRVYTCGSQQYGQCGTGTDGEWIVSAGKTAFKEVEQFKAVPGLAGVKVVAIAAGANHALALTAEGRVWSWGCGAYGRCGHGVPQDQLTPKLIAAFDNERMRVAKIYAGASISFFHLRHDLGGIVYYCGISKKSGEAAMKPQYQDAFVGWRVRAVAAGPTSTVVVGETSVVTYGPSPTSGELGYGADQPKSSTKPKVVDDLEGTYAFDCAMGVASTLVLLDTTSDTPEAERARAVIAAGKLPLLQQPEPGITGVKRKLAEGEGAAAGGAGAGASPAASGGPRPAKKAKTG